MAQHELILLSPYRFPGPNSLVLANDDMAAWLNAYTALWHPALLWNAQGPPRCDAQYDHEQPRPSTIYALPESPPLYLPDDWEERLRAAGSVAFRAGPDRAATLENLRRSLTAPLTPAVSPAGERAATQGWCAGLALPAEEIGPFFGIGLGYLMQATLAEAMEHENLLDAATFWDHVQQAVATLAGFSYTPAAPVYNPETSSYPPYEHYQASAPVSELEAASEPVASGSEGSPQPSPTSAAEETSGANSQSVEAQVPRTDRSAEFRASLREAANKLLSAREVLYPVTIHLLDLMLLDEKNLDKAWPGGLASPLNVIASGRLLEQLAQRAPAKLEALRAKVQADEAEVCGGCYLEREEPLLHLDSQLWNLEKGLAATRALLGVEPRVYARKRFGFYPQLPLLLSTSGIHRSLLLCFDDTSGVPQYSSCVVAWPSPDGKQIDAFVRAPHPADSPATFFNLGHYWFKTTREDHAATLALLHSGEPAIWYNDLVELARLGPVLGTWTTFSRYFNEVMAGEHPAAPTADEFHFDYLSERVNTHLPNPVSAFAAQLRLRRRIDAAWTLAALSHSLGGGQENSPLTRELSEAEDTLERTPGSSPPGFDALEARIAGALADRLQARAAANQPGTMILNPCAFARRVVVEQAGASRPLPVGGQVKACQLDGGMLRAVIDVPALGFTWVPREGPPGTPPMASRLRLADASVKMIRNEFFEAEVDALTGGLKALRDHKTRVNRLGQRLVFNPGSRMVARDIKVTSSGPALGEIVSEGELLGAQEQVLAHFTQRLRVWLGRPLLEMRIELRPVQPPAGYPWHAYFASRFAWRDERAALLRGSGGTGHVTTHTRPQTPDFLELRLAQQATIILPGGLPFHQRHEGRMLDVILQPEGEQATAFELGIALDREVPMQTALGFASPVALVPTTKGPPHVGTSGWLFHLDAPNLLLTRLTPGPLETAGPNSDGVGTAPLGGPEPAKAGTPTSVTARLLECAGYSGHAEFRCVRNPKRAVVLDARGKFLLEASPSGDAVLLEVSPNDLVHLQVEFE
jgi:hypothetical protein